MNSFYDCLLSKRIIACFNEEKEKSIDMQNWNEETGLLTHQLFEMQIEPDSLFSLLDQHTIRKIILLACPKPDEELAPIARKYGKTRITLELANSSELMRRMYLTVALPSIADHAYTNNDAYPDTLGHGDFAEDALPINDIFNQ